MDCEGCFVLFLKNADGNDAFLPSLPSLKQKVWLKDTVGKLHALYVTNISNFAYCIFIESSIISTKNEMRLV